MVSHMDDCSVFLELFLSGNYDRYLCYDWFKFFTGIYDRQLGSTCKGWMACIMHLILFHCILQAKWPIAQVWSHLLCHDTINRQALGTHASLRA